MRELTTCELAANARVPADLMAAILRDLETRGLVEHVPGTRNHWRATERLEHELGPALRELEARR